MSHQSSPANQRWRAIRAEAKSIPVPAGLDPDSVGAQAALWVGQYRRQHGVGPLWNELGDYLHANCMQTCGRGRSEQVAGITRAYHRHRIINRLVRSGWLAATDQPRSLDVGSGPGTGSGYSDRRKPKRQSRSAN